MDIQVVNQRVDQALADNRRAGNLVLLMSSAIFTIGILSILIGYWQRNPYIGGGATLFQGLLYWPIREILRLRRDNIVLQTVPVLVSGLDADTSAKEIIKLLNYLRGKQ
jgi:hypothetical protein